MHEYARIRALAHVPVMSKTRSSRRAALSCMLLSLLLLAGQYSPVARAAAGSLLDQLPQRWSDDQGRDVDLGEFRGRRIFFSMAFTSCRRVCPMTMARLQELQREVDASGQSAEFVIVGYDPSVDDPAAWRQYRRSRGMLRDNWHFLTGPATSTEQFAHRLGFTFWKYDSHVMHDYRIVVVDEQGQLAAEYTPTSDAPHDHSSSAEEPLKSGKH